MGAEPHEDVAFAELAELGVRTVVSVDGAKPQADAARHHGLRYVHIPIGYDGVSEEAGQVTCQARAYCRGTDLHPLPPRKTSRTRGSGGRVSCRRGRGSLKGPSTFSSNLALAVTMLDCGETSKSTRPPTKDAGTACISRGSPSRFPYRCDGPNRSGKRQSQTSSSRLLGSRSPTTRISQLVKRPC